MAEQSDVTIYTDGACSGNPGPGGYGVVLLAGGKRLELSEGYRRTTNNRMELLAVIAALERLNRPCSVRIYSDSQYVVDSVTKRWVYSWQRNNWRKADKKPALNVDLWKRLLPLLEKHNVEFKWVRGHNNNIENERCDELAVAASLGTDLKVDEGFIPAVPV
ncbi:MAG TPA: ribonuclease HI [Candidatus Kapabacteria bacterium]|nr:ribonuclease HI [Candidatus Kapabacteria bacterium]